MFSNSGSKAELLFSDVLAPGIEILEVRLRAATIEFAGLGLGIMASSEFGVQASEPRVRAGRVSLELKVQADKPRGITNLKPLSHKPP